jgi:hypothetical protein
VLRSTPPRIERLLLDPPSMLPPCC